MLNISILKVENPSCLWGRVGDADTLARYAELQDQMDRFYQQAAPDLHRPDPASLEEGTVCVAYWAGRSCWCRAVLRSVVTEPDRCRAFCFLVDHAEVVLVELDRMRVPLQTFLLPPFWARRFHLARIGPVSLRVHLLEDTARLEPSSQWDCAATLRLHRLLRESSQSEAVVLQLEPGSTPMELYLTIRGVKVCVSDVLVAERFACYAGSSGGQDGPARSDGMRDGRRPSNHGGSLERPDWLIAGPYLAAPLLPQIRLLEPDQPEAAVDDQPEANWDDQPKRVPETSAVDCDNPAPGFPCFSDDPEEADRSLASALAGSLALFRLLKFLNPGRVCQLQQREVGEDGAVERRRRPEAPGDPERLPATRDASPGVERRQEARRRAEDGEVWSRLLEWLNPTAVKGDPEAEEEEEEEAPPSDPWLRGVLVHSDLSVEPWSTVADAPLSDSLSQVLRRRSGGALSAADRYVLPAVARGCNTLLISQNPESSLCYLLPLLNNILCDSAHLSHLSCSGPVAVLLCPGWEKAQLVGDLLEECRVSAALHQVLLLVGVAKDEAKAAKLPKNCLLLVTTPFALVRLLAHHCFLFLRMYHLVLDEADRLFALAPDQMATILQHFQKVSCGAEKAGCVRQLVAAARRWSGAMEELIAAHMPNPSIIIGVPEEAALYGGVQQVILMTQESNKMCALLGALDFSPDGGQKTLIVTNSAQEVEEVFKAVSNRSAFCLKTHEGLMDTLDVVLQQWSGTSGPAAHVVLVSTCSCLKALSIRDAACVVHYGFPSSPRLFGSRLFCLAANFRNRSQSTDGVGVARSVLLISERNARHVVGVVRYLRRTDAPPLPALRSFADGVQVAREQLKAQRPLCRYLKSFGFCRDSGACPDRHRAAWPSDPSALPASGDVAVLPLHIRTASVFHGRLVGHDGGQFDAMASEMMSFYAAQKPGAGELQEGALYAVQEEAAFHRVRLLSLPEPGGGGVGVGGGVGGGVPVRFIDSGREGQVEAQQLLQLPPRFLSPPGQAVEVVVCRVKPADGELDWHPKVTRAVSQKVRGLLHRARVVLSLEGTVWVDPMVRLTKMPGSKVVINEYSVQSEILKSGMAASNPEHLDWLRAALEGGADAGSPGSPGWADASLSEEQMLSEAFRAVCVPDPPRQTVAPSGGVAA